MPEILASSRSGALRVSTPGRICLFGEHQDYLRLPVISCAISLRISIEASPSDDRRVILELPDVHAREEFSLQGPVRYGAERDYFRSAVNIMHREGFTFEHGIQGTVRGKIPINSGTSSSSALVVTWISVLAQLSDQQRRLAGHELARLAHLAEVVEFGEPGGMMDHYTTACGGVLAIDFEPALRVEPVNRHLGMYVLGDSREPKDTFGILSRVKEAVQGAVTRLQNLEPEFSLQTATSDDLGRLADHLTPTERQLLDGTLRNRDLTREARLVLGGRSFDHRDLGRLLSEHQVVLRELLRISTPKIDRMLNAAMAAGAYGGKINGSGGGGCMFVYAPENSTRVAAAIEDAGGKAYVIHADEGTRTEEVTPSDA